MTIAKLTTITLDNAPTQDFVESDLQEILGADLDLIPFPSEDPTRPDISSSQQLMTGFTTDISNVDSVAGPISITEVVTFPTGIEPPTGDTIRNTWGFLGDEPLAEEALLGTNVGAAIDNAGGTESGIPQPFNVFFEGEVQAVSGDANDFFLIDLIGDDGVEIKPIDSEGNLIGDFSLEIKSGAGEGLFNNVNLGDFGIVENFELTASSENLSNLELAENVTIDDLPLAGVAFDLEDFSGTDELTSLAGFQITPLNLDDDISSADGSIDILAVGHNSLAIAEPTADNIFTPNFGTTEADTIEVTGSSELIFTGDSNDLIDAVGSQGGNRIYAGGGDDSLILGTGSRLVGGEGSDRFFVTSGGDNKITGGKGADQFWIASAEIPETTNIVTDFTLDEDVLGIAGLEIGFDRIDLTQVENNTLVSAEGSDIAILQGLDAANLTVDDFVFA